jgi:hypothetical protein
MNISRERMEQLLHSVPHYFYEAISAFKEREIKQFLYYKFPYCFKLQNFPLNIDIELINTCNLNCHYCERNIIKRNIRHLNLNLFKKIVDEIAQHPKHRVKMCGLGEPVLHPNINKILDYTRDRNISVMFYTNGLFLLKYSPLKILSWNLKTIVISIDRHHFKSINQLGLSKNYQNLYYNLEKLYNLRKKNKLPRPQIEIRHTMSSDENKIMLGRFKKKWSKISDTIKYNFLLDPFSDNGKYYTNIKRCRNIRRDIHIRSNGKILLCGYIEGVHDTIWIGDMQNETIKDG